MNGVARQFEPQITRSGGAPSKFRFTIRCSDCAATDTYDASWPTGNDAVRGYFKNRGWLLGRAASFDVCPACLARPRDSQETQPACRRREARALDNRHRNTAGILARHLGKPEALAAEVFRPKEAKPVQPPTLQAPLPAHARQALSPEIEQALSGMAADLRGLRSVVELMADQVTQLIALGGRQIEAFANLPPTLAQSTEGLADGLRQVAHAIHALPHRLPPVTDQASGTSAEATQTQAVDAEPAPVAEPAGHEPLRRTRGTRTTKGKALRSERTEIVVKSISDAKRSGRFYTSVRLPRQLWDQAGFGPEDRLLLDWDGSTMSIERTSEGGVTPKSIGGKSVVLQSWKLGNLNFDSPSIAGTGGFLRLVGNQR